MDTFNLRSVQLGGMRIGGLLGHALDAARRWTTRRALKFAALAILAGASGSLVAIFGVRYLNYRHAQALLSPIQKMTYTVEDAHGAGQYMVVKNGTTHLKLQCAGGGFKDEKGNHRTLDRFDCYEFKIGDQLMLEKWDQGEWHSITYVYKMKQQEGEYNYTELLDLGR